MLGALLKSIPEQSMRVQVRYEVVQGTGDLIERYAGQYARDTEAIQQLDLARLEAWHSKERQGHYLRPLLHVYFIWDPQVHHRVTGRPDPRKLSFGPSARKCIERSRKEHEGLLAEFESLLVGIEATMQASELGARRLNEQELFLEAKRALNPLEPDNLGFKLAGQLLRIFPAAGLRRTAHLLAIQQQSANPFGTVAAPPVNITGALAAFKVPRIDIEHGPLPSAIPQLAQSVEAE